MIQRRMMMAVLALLVACSTLLAVAPAGAAPRQRCFAQTGQCVAGAILDYWEKNGGLTVFGYPITALDTEWNNDHWNGPTQWFERDRIEDHATDGQGVLAGRLGAQYLDMAGRPTANFPKADPSNPQAGCRYFAETGHSLCGKFLEYWSKNGGLSRFGYPVSEPINEELATWGGTAQYFERRRMELHPENAGTPYEVLLGLLGRDLQVAMTGGCAETISSLQKTALAFGEGFSCAGPFPLINVPIVEQQFERGQMIWVQAAGTSQGRIYVIFYDTNRSRLVYKYFYDTWREGDANSSGETPPSGKVEPIGGFGKVWRENPFVRDTLGWAVTTEAANRGHVQYFRSGNHRSSNQMIYRSSSDRVFLVYGQTLGGDDATLNDVERVK